MAKKQSKGGIVLKVICVLLALAVIGVGVWFVFKHTNGFKDDFKTFYVECNGKRIGTESKAELVRGQKYTYTVTYPFGAGKGEAYTVKVVPNAEANFTYEAAGEQTAWKDAGELTAAFGLEKKESSFIFTVSEDVTLSSVVQSLHEGKAVTLPSEESFPNKYFYTLVISSKNDAVKFEVDFKLKEPDITISLDPSEIVFS